MAEFDTKMGIGWNSSCVVAIAAVCNIEAIAKWVGDGKGREGVRLSKYTQPTQVIALKDTDAV